MYESTTFQAMSSNVPPGILSSVKHGQTDLEPDDAWKDTLRKRIKELKSMIDDTTTARDNQLASIPPNDPRQEGIRKDFDNSMKNIVKDRKSVV